MNPEEKIMVFRPTWEEFKNFSKYVEHMESLGAHKAGIAKVVPPPQWIPRKKSYLSEDIMNINIPAPQYQNVIGKLGVYQQRNIIEQNNSMTVEVYKSMAESPKYNTPSFSDYNDLERKYWKYIMYNRNPLYGADVSGSITDTDVNEWNINKLDTILDLVEKDYGMKIDGVNSSYLYFGMWKTSFPWHTEDMDLYSINYIHYGSPKSWYAIPPSQGRRFEMLASNYFQDSKICSAFLRHKMYLMSPTVLKTNGIKFDKITQESGEFIITFPYGYHSGYNNGFNMAESANFALPRWVEYGKRTRLCSCRSDIIKIDMTTFIKKFQPEKFELWKSGRDIGCHPEDPTRKFAAPL
eukprot:XP_001949351.3 PREDICTED: probable lysine-specific demethylase 4B [Acyrthosiphon pisum]